MSKSTEAIKVKHYEGTKGWASRMLSPFEEMDREFDSMFRRNSKTKGRDMTRKIASLVLVALVSGCAAQTFNINGSGAGVPTDQKSQHFFISGLGQQKITNAAEICGGADNVIKVEAQQTFINGLLGAITWGIYTPRDAKVYCQQ